MRRLVLAVTLFISCHLVYGQSVTPQVVASGGGYWVNAQANLSISFTVGEMSQVETFSAQGYHLTQGFQQPNFDLVGLQEQDFVNLFEVFPNPADAFLNVRYDLLHPGTLSMHLFDLNGVEVVEAFQDNYSGGLEEFSFPLDGLAHGMYFLQVRYQVPSKAIEHLSHFKINVIHP